MAAIPNPAGQKVLPSWLLLLLPLIAYGASYLYLAYYHHRWLLFDTVIHEGGRYSLLETMLYASHFLGHVPVYTMLAFYFVGVHQCLAVSCGRPFSQSTRRWLIGSLIGLIVVSFLISLIAFGLEDTLSYIRQSKQGVNIYQQGGSWNLHLPSSLLLVFLIPVYILFVRLIYKRPVEPSYGGLPYLLIGILVLTLFTVLVNTDNLYTVPEILQNPRYLGHSVRELMTFTVTYFPLPLFILLGREIHVERTVSPVQKRRFYQLMAMLMVLFLLGFFYQSYVSLVAGIGELAQKPYFAKNGRLGIPYLLASHYFEHFLDSVYFTLLCLVLYSYAGQEKMMPNHNQPDANSRKDA